MKKNMFVILVGVAVLHIAVFGGLFVSGGCSSVVMDKRGYIEPTDTSATQPMDDFTAPAGTESPAPAAPAAATVNTPAAKPVAPAVKSYEPMTGSTGSKGVSSTAASTAKSTPGGNYTVKAGDTIGKIANANGVSVAAMLKANNLTLKSARQIRIGQKLVIPAGGKTVAKGGAISAMTKSTARNVTAPAAATAAVAADGTYTVKAGDSIPLIARRLGVKSSELQKANNLSDAATRRLQIGQKLVVPGKGSAVTMSTPVEAKSVDNGSAAPAAAVAPISSQEIDDILKGAETTPVGGQPAAAVTPGTASNTPAPAATGTAVVETGVTDFVSGGSIPVEVEEETITVEEYCTKHSIPLESFKALNSDLPKDNILRKTNLVMIPAK